MPIRLRAPPGRPYVVGHRGAMGHAPENTLAGFGTGVELGAPMLELDVRSGATPPLLVEPRPNYDRASVT